MIDTVTAAASSTTPAVITGTASLLGVIIGGALTGAVQEYREGRKDRRLAAAGARLLRDDLERARAAVESVLRDRAVAAEQLPTAPGWPAYREALAQRLGEVAWFDLRTAVDRIDRAAATLRPFVRANGPSGPLPAPLLAELEDLPGAIDHAVAGLPREHRAR